jgi:hypothetical protein
VADGTRRWTILGGDFTPTEDDVRAIEAALPNKLAEVGPSLVPKWHAPDPFWERLDDYRRQYSGVARPEGNVIVGNVVSKGFCFDERWRTEPVFIDDGGYGVLTVTWDMATRAIVSIVSNGWA